MRFIVAHRGNVAGPSARENHPQLVRECLGMGFAAELDLWQMGGDFWLGHDEPRYRIDLDEFDQEGVFFHLKTPVIPPLKQADAFAINLDEYVVTLRGRIWANHGQPPSAQSIMCSPELVGANEDFEAFLGRISGSLGVCTDYPARVKELVR